VQRLPTAYLLPIVGQTEIRHLRLKGSFGQNTSLLVADEVTRPIEQFGRFGGTGLGLAITRKLARMMGSRRRSGNTSALLTKMTTVRGLQPQPEESLGRTIGQSLG
jgi:hypothetical protein